MKVLSSSEIKQLYEFWVKLAPITAKEARKRGFEFERILYSILKNESLEPIAGYRPKGEQVDGSFFWCGQTFLLEAKWHKDRLPVSSIYSFKGKVDGKFHTTSGVFISIGGYSDDVSDALRFGKSVNILLFDKGDMDAIVLSNVSFIEVLKYKIRQAGDTGNAYVSYKVNTELGKMKPVVSSSSTIKMYAGSDSGVDLGDPKDPLFLVICEGKSDERYLINLFQHLEFASPVAFQFKVLNGFYNLLKIVPTLVNTMTRSKNQKFNVKGVIVILDDDNQGRAILERFNDTLKETLKDNAISSEILLLSTPTSQAENKQSGISSRELSAIKAFINAQIYFETDFDQEEGETTIERILAQIEGDKEAKSAYYPGEDKHSGKTFDSLDKLVSFLTEEAEGAATSVVSWDSEFLATYESPDFLQTIYECLENYRTQIESIGWELE